MFFGFFGDFEDFLDFLETPQSWGPFLGTPGPPKSGPPKSEVLGVKSINGSMLESICVLQEDQRHAALTGETTVIKKKLKNISVKIAYCSLSRIYSVLLRMTLQVRHDS